MNKKSKYWIPHIEFGIENYKFRPAVLTLIFILSWLLPDFTYGQSKVVKFSSARRNQLRFTLSFNTIYDDNIFRYSDDYLYDFQHQIRSYRFPFRSCDDFIVLLNPSLRISGFLMPKSIIPISHFYLNYKQYQYTINAEKSYQIFSMAVNQSFTKKFSSEIEYLYIPRYLIRYYQDPLSNIGSSASTKYIPCLFSEHLFTVEMVYKLTTFLSGSSNVKPFLRYEIDNYERNFDFYDSKAIRYGVNVSSVIIKKLSLELSAEQKHNWAKGPKPDISYLETNFTLGAKYLIPKFWHDQIRKLKIGIDVDWAIRKYTTQNTYQTDPFHRDRTDNKYGWKINLNYQLSKMIELHGKYEQEFRKVKSPYRADIDDIKDYKNNQIGIGIKLVI